MRQLGLETAVQLHRLARAIETIDVDGYDSVNRLQERDDFAQINGLAELSFLERKGIAQCATRRRQNFLRFVIRIDFDFARNPEEAFSIRDGSKWHERIARRVNRRDEIRNQRVRNRST